MAGPPQIDSTVQGSISLLMLEVSLLHQAVQLEKNDNNKKKKKEFKVSKGWKLAWGIFKGGSLKLSSTLNYSTRPCCSLRSILVVIVLRKKSFHFIQKKSSLFRQ